MKPAIAAPRQARRAPPRGLAWLLLTALLSACGGGGGDSSGPGPVAAMCDAGPRKAALSNYFNDSYFWYRSSPRPDPASALSLDDHFLALLYTGNGTGSDAAFPADRWSFFDTTVNFNRFFGDGKTLGYGLFVSGVEVTDRPDLPLYVRYTEPQSPAAAAGLVRGDRILSINGKAVADVIRDNDYSALTPSAEGVSLSLLIAPVTGAANRSVLLSGAIYSLTPVTHQAVVTSPGGRRAGYLVVKDMVSQALLPMTVAMLNFRAAGVTELVLDLRYNGGGLVTVGRDIASLIAGPRGNARTYASLLYNDKQAAARNTVYTFNNPAQALGLQRVYILVGERTCSASEQVAVGLRPVVDVVMVGRTTCGKPVGFLPHNDGCGNSYNVVNFESVNAVNDGRYVDGLRPTCAASEDWTRPLGSTSEPFLAIALQHADGLACVPPAAATQARAQGLAAQRRLVFDGERPTMIAP